MLIRTLGKLYCVSHRLTHHFPVGMTKTSSKTVLITFARSYLALEAARQWHAKGHRVIVTDSITLPISRFSNAVSKYYKVPSPRFHHNAYIKELSRIIKEQKVDILFPVYEEISYIAKAKNAIPSHCTVFAPEFELYNTLQNKWLFQELLTSLGIPTLKASLISNHSDLVSHNFQTPFALKPCYSRASQKIKKVAHDVAPPNLSYEPHNPWMAQEWATGNKYCTYSVCHNGKLSALSIYPVNYAIDGHSCLTFESVEHQGILNWITHFVKSINYTGQIAFDFIEDRQGRLYAIECNPRATSGLLLFGLKDGLCNAFVDTNQHLIVPGKGARRQIAAGMLLYGWRKESKKDNRFRDFLKHFLSTRDVIYRTRDIKPFLSEPLVFAKIWLNSKKMKLSIPNYFTYDHDWNGEPIESISVR